jgi:tellurite resistance protein TerC
MEDLKRSGRRIGIAIAGFSVMAVGFVLLFLPGPGLLLIAAGLAILAIEFDWAKRHHNRVKKTIKKSVKKLNR